MSLPIPELGLEEAAAAADGICSTSHQAVGDGRPALNTEHTTEHTEGLPAAAGCGDLHAQKQGASEAPRQGSGQGSEHGQQGGPHTPDPKPLDNMHHNGQEERGSSSDDESGGSSGGDGSDEGDVEEVLLKIVPEASMVQPGHRSACGMPLDMNSLQESLEGMARLANRR